jgi:hypothetical protein
MTAPTIENKTSTEGDGSSFSWSHTCSGTNRGMVLGTMRWNNGGETIDTVTYNSVGLTFESVDELSSGDGHKVGFFYLIAPATGSNTLAITMSATTSMQAELYSLNNCHQTTMIGNVPSAIAVSADTTPSTGVSSDDTNCLIVDFVARFEATSPTITAGAGQTEEFNRNATGPTFGAGSREAGTAGIVTMSWTLSVGAPWAIIGGAILGTNDKFWIFGKKD